jgi:molybdate transport system substrate-binding protein
MRSETGRLFYLDSQGDNMRRIAIWFLVLATGLVFVGSASAGELNLSVAASLADVVRELSGSYTKSHPGVGFHGNFGGSGALTKQIENGAPCDLFISANLEWMDYLKDKRFMDEKSIGVFAYNELVFVGRPESKVATLKDVVKLSKIAIGSPKSVPAGQYATEAFKRGGIENDLNGKLVMAKDVRECLLYADRGEVEGAFVYKTDALEKAQTVKILFAVDQKLYPRVTYPIGLTVSGGKRAEAVDFLKFLRGDEGKKVLRKHGFIVE